jgi:hypothetical protein
VAIGTLLIVIGLALVVSAFVSWRRSRKSATNGTPKWLAAAGTMGPGAAFWLALVLNVRPKALLLSAAAGLSSRGDGWARGETVITVAFYTIVSASSIAIPIVSARLRPDSSEKWLVPTHDWITTNSAIVSNLILVMVGVVIIGNGLTRL